ncbi:MAG: ATP-binding protein, partial [Deltaproteobacteria bacterium]|nr:ATP-binding protein [Deltaproteobacteria bacterium]
MPQRTFYSAILSTFNIVGDTNKACREGYRALYLRAPEFAYQMALARGDGSYGKTIKKLATTHVLVIDDLGLTPMSDAERRDLLEVVEDR